MFALATLQHLVIEAKVGLQIFLKKMDSTDEVKKSLKKLVAMAI